MFMSKFHPAGQSGWLKTGLKGLDSTFNNR